MVPRRHCEVKGIRSHSHLLALPSSSSAAFIILLDRRSSAARATGQTRCNWLGSVPLHLTLSPCRPVARHLPCNLIGVARARTRASLRSRSGRELLPHPCRPQRMLRVHGTEGLTEWTGVCSRCADSGRPCGRARAWPQRGSFCPGSQLSPCSGSALPCAASRKVEKGTFLSWTHLLPIAEGMPSRGHLARGRACPVDLARSEAGGCAP